MERNLMALLSRGEKINDSDSDHDRCVRAPIPQWDRQRDGVARYFWHMGFWNLFRIFHDGSNPHPDRLRASRHVKHASAH